MAERHEKWRVWTPIGMGINIFMSVLGFGLLIYFANNFVENFKSSLHRIENKLDGYVIENQKAHDEIRSTMMQRCCSEMYPQQRYGG